MKHKIAELLDIVYKHYPRGIDLIEEVDVQRYKNTEEYARLVAARRRAAADERWRALLHRVDERSPSSVVMNGSLHLPTGSLDACYSLSISPRNANNDRTLWAHISFLAPYYLVHGWRLAEVARRPERFSVDLYGATFVVPQSPRDPTLVSNPEDPKLDVVTSKESHVSFELSEDERECADWLIRDIEATFKCEHMPPEVGSLLVPDVAVNLRCLGKATLYDCLFTDYHEWVPRSPSDMGTPTIKIDASSLTDSFVSALTVQAALYHMMRALMPELQSGACFVSMHTDGVLHKDDALNGLEKIRKLIEFPKTAQAIARQRELESATRELEALVAAWDGEGMPTAAMVAWASRFLDSWDQDKKRS